MGIITDEGLYAIVLLCYKLEYLNISYCTDIHELSICNIIRSCPKLQQLDLRFCKITNITIEEIASSCLNLKYFNLERCYKISKEVVNKLNSNIYVENFVKIPDLIKVVNNQILAQGLQSLLDLNMQARSTVWNGLR